MIQCLSFVILSMRNRQELPPKGKGERGGDRNIGNEIVKETNGENKNRIYHLTKWFMFIEIFSFYLR